MGRPFLLEIAPSHGDLDFLLPIRAHNPNGISSGSAVFAQLIAESPYTLQWAAPSPLKIAHSHRGSGPPSNTWFLWPIRILNPDGISICLTVSAGLTTATDRQTDQQTGRLTDQQTTLLSL